EKRTANGANFIRRALAEAEAEAVRAKEPVFRVRISDREGPSGSRIQRRGGAHIRGSQRQNLSFRVGASGSIRKKIPVTSRISRGVYVPFNKKRIGIGSQSSVFERLG
ncbi:unnamed protein product, partial [Toxocara canis]